MDTVSSYFLRVNFYVDIQDGPMKNTHGEDKCTLLRLLDPEDE
jgi:hypothetical protein